ncbi:MAG: hypothetical protein RL398_3632 [Planctomycetota bacterium]
MILQGNGKLVQLSRDGAVEWEMPWGGIHDLHRTSAGTLLLQQGMTKVVELDPATHNVRVRYDAASRADNAGKRVEIHSFVPLADGGLLVAESGPARLLELGPDGAERRSTPLRVGKPDPHRDTRLIRRCPNGNVLVCHEGDGCVREYDLVSGNVVWEFAVPMFDRAPAGGHGPEAFGNAVFGAVRLPSGNTLVATGNGHAVLEVDRAGAIVWRLEQRDLPGIVLAWVTTLEVLPNGNYVLGNCHAGPGQPLLVEVEPASKRVVWQLDAFERFGNSVSNSLLLDVAAIR